MNHYLNILLRSIIESITEFLPVSSTGHLFLFGSFFPFQLENGDNLAFDDLFDIFIQSGAIFSVIVLYFQFILSKSKLAIDYIQKKSKDISGIHFFITIIIGSFPILIAGFIFKSKLDIIKSSDILLFILGLAWLIGGLIIIVVEQKLSQFDVEIEKSSPHFNMHVTIMQSLIVGLLQCVALIPGVSRSAATIITGRLIGLSKKDAAEYSFFLAIPVLISASIYKLYKHRTILTNDNLIYLSIGFILSFIFCLIIIKWFLSFIRKHSFVSFGIYRVVLGVVVIVYYFNM